MKKRRSIHSNSRGKQEREREREQRPDVQIDALGHAIGELLLLERIRVDVTKATTATTAAATIETAAAATARKALPLTPQRMMENEKWTVWGKGEERKRRRETHKGAATASAHVVVATHVVAREVAAATAAAKARGGTRIETRRFRLRGETRFATRLDAHGNIGSRRGSRAIAQRGGHILAIEELLRGEEEKKKKERKSNMNLGSFVSIRSYLFHRGIVVRCLRLVIEIAHKIG